MTNSRETVVIRNWVRSLSDDVLFGFAAKSEPCYRELFRRYGPLVYQSAMKFSEERPDIGLEAFASVWSRIRSEGYCAHSSYQLGKPVRPFNIGLMIKVVRDLLDDPMSKKDAA